jgi:hypothetical protein
MSKEAGRALHNSEKYAQSFAAGIILLLMKLQFLVVEFQASVKFRASDNVAKIVELTETQNSACGPDPFPYTLLPGCQSVEALFYLFIYYEYRITGEH